MDTSSPHAPTGRPHRPVKVVADRDDAGHWRFRWSGFWHPSQLRRAEARQTAQWDPEAGVIFSVRLRDRGAAFLRAAFVGSDVYHELERRGLLGSTAPTTYPLFTPSGDHVQGVRPALAASLVDHGLARWVDAEQHTLGLRLRPLTTEERGDRPPGASSARKPRRRDPPPEDVFAHWVRRIPAHQAETIVLEAACPSHAWGPIPDGPASHLVWAAHTLLARLPDRFAARMRRDPDGPTRIRQWVGAVRAGAPVTRALWRALEWRRPPPRRTRGAEWGADR